MLLVKKYPNQEQLPWKKTLVWPELSSSQQNIYNQYFQPLQGLDFSLSGMGSQELSGLIVIENITETKLLSCPWTGDI